MLQFQSALINPEILLIDPENLEFTLTVAGFPREYQKEMPYNKAIRMAYRWQLMQMSQSMLSIIRPLGRKLNPSMEDVIADRKKFMKTMEWPAGLGLETPEGGVVPPAKPFKVYQRKKRKY